MVVSEQYPSLKANQGFSDLRVQLEGTENRVTVARNRYIQAVQACNVLARSFPSNLTTMVFSYQPKPTFAVQNKAAISTPPVVDFTKKQPSCADTSHEINSSGATAACLVPLAERRGLWVAAGRNTTRFCAIGGSSAERPCHGHHGYAKRTAGAGARRQRRSNIQTDFWRGFAGARR